MADLKAQAPNELPPQLKKYLEEKIKAMPDFPSPEARKYIRDALEVLMTSLWLHKDTDSYSETYAVEKIIIPFIRESKEQDRFQNARANQIRQSKQLQDGGFENIINQMFVEIKAWNKRNDRVEFSTRKARTALAHTITKSEADLFPLLKEEITEIQAKKRREKEGKVDMEMTTVSLKKN